MIIVILIAVLFGTSHDACVTRYPHRAPESGRRYFNTFDSLFERVGLERNIAPGLLKAIAWCETRLDPCSVSSAGAQGLMQFMPSTFETVSAAANASDPFEPEHAVRSAGVYVAALVNYFGGRLDAVVASYNAGPAAVDRAIRRGHTIPAIAETQAYVGCVLGAFSHFGGPQRVRSSDASWLTDLVSLFRSPTSGSAR